MASSSILNCPSRCHQRANTLHGCGTLYDQVIMSCYIGLKYRICAVYHHQYSWPGLLPTGRLAFLLYSWWTMCELYLLCLHIVLVEVVKRGVSTLCACVWSRRKHAGHSMQGDVAGGGPSQDWWHRSEPQAVGTDVGRLQQHSSQCHRSVWSRCSWSLLWFRWSVSCVHVQLVHFGFQVELLQRNSRVLGWWVVFLFLYIFYAWLGNIPVKNTELLLLE